jgi:hypothetical protein
MTLTSSAIDTQYSPFVMYRKERKKYTYLLQTTTQLLMFYKLPIVSLSLLKLSKHVNVSSNDKNQD